MEGLFVKHKYDFDNEGYVMECEYVSKDKYDIKSSRDYKFYQHRFSCKEYNDKDNIGCDMIKTMVTNVNDTTYD